MLLARPRDSDAPVGFDDPDVAERFNDARHRINAGDGSLVELCVAEDLVLLPARLQFVAHWLTPVGEARRFDTRFFVAEAPPSQEPLHDDAETIASIWVRPADALARSKARELQMFPPTVGLAAHVGRARHGCRGHDGGGVGGCAAAARAEADRQRRKAASPAFACRARTASTKPPHPST